MNTPSLTYDEADDVNDKSSGNTSSGLTNITAEKNGDGYYEASVTIDVQISELLMLKFIQKTVMYGYLIITEQKLKKRKKKINYVF